jgi:Ni/Fe-hydrogenase subunit HybB-like protein
MTVQSDSQPGNQPDSDVGIARLPLSADFGWGWTAAFAVSVFFVLVFAVGLALPAWWGVGVWGINIPFVWGFDLVNYVWWIGIANGTSFLAALLAIRRHELRTAVNRFAESVALFAVICAALFPIIHLGRPWLFYWMIPYPATFEVWPQFRSPLTWDFWAILAHVIVTGLLWYIGLLPDLASLRDRSARPLAQKAFALFALGWRGSGQHWVYHRTAYGLVAGLVLAMVVVIQTTVSFEFATTLVPDWHKTRLPLHFVVTGLASGLAIVLAAAVLLRRLHGLEAYITRVNVDLMAILIAANGLAIALVLLEEYVVLILSAPATREATLARLIGDYGWTYWAAFLLMAVTPQALWAEAIRRSLIGPLLVSIAMLVGVWLDRFSIIVGGVQRDYLPSIWRSYSPTWEEFFILFGSLGLFASLVLLFVRYLPVISMFEHRHASQDGE